MGCTQRGVDPLQLQHAPEAFHAQTATGTQASRNGLFRHADSPLDAWDMHEITVTVVPNIGDGATCFRDFDSILQGDIGPHRLNRSVPALSPPHLTDPPNTLPFPET